MMHAYIEDITLRSVIEEYFQNIENEDLRKELCKELTTFIMERFKK